MRLRRWIGSMATTAEDEINTGFVRQRRTLCLLTRVRSLLSHSLPTHPFCYQSRQASKHKGESLCEYVSVVGPCLFE